MKFRTLMLAAGMALAGSAASMAMAAGEQGAPAGDYIVMFEWHFNERSVADTVTAATPQAKVMQVWTNAINGVLLSGLTPEAAKELARQPGVLSVEPSQDIALEPLPEDGAKSDATLQEVAVGPVTTAAQINPPWGLDRIDQRSRPLNQTYNYIRMGTGVTVYVVDSGVRVSHQDFYSLFGTRGLTRASNAFNALSDRDVDLRGHGTHVAGIIGGLTRGVAKDVWIKSVRVCHQTACPLPAVLSGLNYIASNMSGPTVVNFSLAQFESPAISAAIVELTKNGAFFVSAAGNSGANICNAPAGSIVHAQGNHVVAATTGIDGLLRASNFGPCIFMSAPGDVINSTGVNSDTAYRNETGTSMAAPHVAGAAALILQEFPTYTSQQVANLLLARATTNLPSFWTGSGGMDTGHLTPNRLLYTLP